MATAAILDFFADLKVKVNVDNWSLLPVLKSIAKAKYWRNLVLLSSM